MNDPWFGYLRELSQFIVMIDEALDSKDQPVTGANAAHFIQRTRALLIPAEAGEGFERRYYEAMQRDPDVILAHGALMRVLAGIEAG
jgi:hypothetical protein